MLQSSHDMVSNAMGTEPKDSMKKLWEKLHEDACARGELFYIDPATGYQVNTKIYLESIGKCCESGCRHCPYGFARAKG